MRRVRARVEGTVQGVGFRPFVYRLASELDLSGFVLNDERGVLLEVEGGDAAVDGFLRRLAEEAPDVAEVLLDTLTVQPGERLLDVGCGTGNLALGAVTRGARVTAVDPASDAAEEGLQRGDLIMSVNRQAVSSPADVLSAVAAARRAGRTSVLLLVKRGPGPEAFVAVQIGAAR